MVYEFVIVFIEVVNVWPVLLLRRQPPQTRQSQGLKCDFHLRNLLAVTKHIFLDDL